jgi:xanthine dehydrogenase large subunit
MKMKNGSTPATMVHQAIQHDSAHKHVSGSARYVDDIAVPSDTLQILLGKSKFAHAKILSLDLSQVENFPGVVKVLTSADIPGTNDCSPFAGDDPIFAEDIVSYMGQSLFAIIAEDIKIARDAIELAIVEYEELPAILTIDQALEVGSILGPPAVIECGSADAALEKSKNSLEGAITLGGQEHFYLEGQAAYALPGEDTDMVVHCSTQHPTEIQHKVAMALGLSNHDVTVITRRMGGGFGGKESQGNLPAIVAALAANLTGRPAKIIYDRDDDFILTGKRHDFQISYKVGFGDDGSIESLIVDQAMRCGMSWDLSEAIAARAMCHAENSYFIQNMRITSHRLKTNTQSNTAFRGFGGPQGIVGMERVIDHVAHHLNVDPLLVRERNFYPHKTSTKHGSTPYGQTVHDCIIQDITSELKKTSSYLERRKDIDKFNQDSDFLKRGIALTPVKFGISFNASFLNQAGALLHIYNDGSVYLNHGGTEMGQGLNTKIAQVVANEFQLPLDKIKITATSTGKVPNTSATAASSGSDLNGMAAKNAAEKIKFRMAEYLAAEAQIKPDQVIFENGKVSVGVNEYNFSDAVMRCYMGRISLSATGFYSTPKVHWDPKTLKGRPFYYFAYGAACSEVALDLLTGENRILRTDILHDVGKSLNPVIDIGQIEGGYVQGAGWLTTEELVWDSKGRLLTHAPSTYKIPACSDRPIDFRVELFSDGENCEETIHRSKAVGEPPLMLGTSVLMALSHALQSVSAQNIYPNLNAPATPEKLLMQSLCLGGPSV